MNGRKRVIFCGRLWLSVVNAVIGNCFWAVQMLADNNFPPKTRAGDSWQRPPEGCFQVSHFRCLNMTSATISHFPLYQMPSSNIAQWHRVCCKTLQRAQTNRVMTRFCWGAVCAYREQLLSRNSVRNRKRSSHRAQAVNVTGFQVVAR